MKMEKKWMFPLVLIGSLVCIFLVAASLNMGPAVSLSLYKISTILSSSAGDATNQTSSVVSDGSNQTPASSLPVPSPVPKFAYLISGSSGELDQLWRTLFAVYHPWNYYVLHLDLESPVDERLELASRVEKQPLFAKIGNVFVNSKANLVTYRGPTMVSNTLHGCAILLKRYNDWDWFINLSASDYPLITQDDLLETFTSLNRDYNFIEHTSQLDWKESVRAMPLIVDPGLYENNKSDVFWVTPNRNLPTSFKLFTGSAWMILSRNFVEYVIWGWDNLPRTLLMYYTNFLSSPEGYFQTIICNSLRFIPTVLNHDMHFISWDMPPLQHPRTITLNDTNQMMASGAAFARKFKRGTKVLDFIDKELLNRTIFTPGGWCDQGKPPCSEIGNINRTKLNPGPGAKRLKRLLDWLLSDAKLPQNQCI